MTDTVQKKSDTNAAVPEPFAGLRAFERRQAEFFFGRRNEVRILEDKLEENRFVGVIGESGSGKSSLVKAGLLPALTEDLFWGDGYDWRFAIMTPGSEPINRLATALALALTGDLNTDRSIDEADIGEDAQLRETREEIARLLRGGSLGIINVLRRFPLPEGENLLILADQFEELFRLQEIRRSWESIKQEASEFANLLTTVSNQREFPVYIVLTMRSEFIGDCSTLPTLTDELNQSLYVVPRLSYEQLEEVIVAPPEQVNVCVEDDLKRKLIMDARQTPELADTLPLLQHALLQTWRKRQEEVKQMRQEGIPENELQVLPMALRHYEAIGWEVGKERPNPEKRSPLPTFVPLDPTTQAFFGVLEKLTRAQSALWLVKMNTLPYVTSLAGNVSLLQQGLDKHAEQTYQSLEKGPDSAVSPLITQEKNELVISPRAERCKRIAERLFRSLVQRVNFRDTRRPTRRSELKRILLREWIAPGDLKKLDKGKANEKSSDLKSTQPAKQSVTPGEIDEDLEFVIDTFNAAGLLTIRPLEDDIELDIPHEALYRQWERYAVWRREEMLGRRIYHRLCEEAFRKSSPGWSWLGCKEAVEWFRAEHPSLEWVLHYPSVQEENENDVASVASRHVSSLAGEGNDSPESTEKVSTSPSEDRAKSEQQKQTEWDASRGFLRRSIRRTYNTTIGLILLLSASVLLPFVFIFVANFYYVLPYASAGVQVEGIRKELATGDSRSALQQAEAMINLFPIKELAPREIRQTLSDAVLAAEHIVPFGTEVTSVTWSRDGKIAIAWQGLANMSPFTVWDIENGRRLKLTALPSFWNAALPTRPGNRRTNQIDFDPVSRRLVIFTGNEKQSGEIVVWQLDPVTDNVSIKPLLTFTVKDKVYPTTGSPIVKGEPSRDDLLRLYVVAGGKGILYFTGRLYTGNTAYQLNREQTSVRVNLLSVAKGSAQTPFRGFPVAYSDARNVLSPDGNFLMIRVAGQSSGTVAQRMSHELELWDIHSFPAKRVKIQSRDASGRVTSLSRLDYWGETLKETLITEYIRFSEDSSECVISTAVAAYSFEGKSFVLDSSAKPTRQSPCFLLRMVPNKGWQLAKTVWIDTPRGRPLPLTFSADTRYAILPMDYAGLSGEMGTNLFLLEEGTKTTVSPLALKAKGSHPNGTINLVAEQFLTSDKEMKTGGVRILAAEELGNLWDGSKDSPLSRQLSTSPINNWPIGNVALFEAKGKEVRERMELPGAILSVRRDGTSFVSANDNGVLSIISPYRVQPDGANRLSNNHVFDDLSSDKAYYWGLSEEANFVLIQQQVPGNRPAAASGSGKVTEAPLIPTGLWDMEAGTRKVDLSVISQKMGFMAFAPATDAGSGNDLSTTSNDLNESRFSVHPEGDAVVTWDTLGRATLYYKLSELESTLNGKTPSKRGISQLLQKVMELRERYGWSNDLREH